MIAAAAASDETDFFDRLRAGGLLVKPRESSIHPGEITGYAVGLPGYRNADGETVWYGGGKLAPDLTLLKLRHRWPTDTSGTTAPDAKSTTRKRPGLTELAETFHRAAQAAVHVEQVGGVDAGLERVEQVVVGLATDERLDHGGGVDDDHRRLSCTACTTSAVAGPRERSLVLSRWTISALVGRAARVASSRAT
jgi:hypothetical protein